MLRVQYSRMIRSFRDRDTQRFYEGERVAAFEGFADRAVRRLTLLEGAEALRDLTGLPSNRLEASPGDRAGHHCIWVDGQRRICFRWEAERPSEVAVRDCR